MNLIGALTAALHDRVTGSVQTAAGRSGAAAAVLVTTLGQPGIAVVALAAAPGISDVAACLTSAVAVLGAGCLVRRVRLPRPAPIVVLAGALEPGWRTCCSTPALRGPAARTRR